MFAFRLGSIPVRIHFSFVLVVAMLGANGSSLKGLAAWIVVVLVSVLLHEMGHALAGITFGLSPQIDLVGFGGLTSWSGGRDDLGAARRVAISLAGPAVGILLGMALTVWQSTHAAPVSPDAAALVGMIIEVNLFWGLLNLLPIVPLDGGNVLRAVLHQVMGPRGERAANIASIGVAVVCGVAAFVVWGRDRATYPLVLLAMFVVQNVRALSAGNAMEREAPLRETLRGGYDALARGDTASAARAGQEVLAGSSFPAVRADAVRLLAFAHLTSGAWGPLMDLMESPVSVAIPPDELAKFEQAARELDRPDEAARIAAIRAKRSVPTGA